MNSRTKRFIASYRKTVMENPTDAAEKMGIKRPNLVRVLSGKLDASVNMIEAYCNAYGIDMAEIICGTESDRTKVLQATILKLRIIIAEKDRTIKALMKS